MPKALTDAEQFFGDLIRAKLANGADMLVARGAANRLLIDALILAEGDSDLGLLLEAYLDGKSATDDCDLEDAEEASSRLMGCAKDITDNWQYDAEIGSRPEQFLGEFLMDCRSEEV